MPSPERAKHNLAGTTDRQRCGRPYVAVARFDSERKALSAYKKMQEMVVLSDWDFSFYRMLLVCSE
jgi:hypothetical protein